MIKRNVILTAAHCIPKTVRFTYNSIIYTTSVEPNQYYPTYGSMYSVSLGVQDKSTSSSTTIEVGVGEVIQVKANS